jgi:MFS family permease
MPCVVILAETASPFSKPCRALMVFGVTTAITFSASSGAPTPLYRLYQEQLGLSPFILTVIFAAYVFSLLAALLTVGSLSDYIGRRPVTFAALALNALAMCLFIEAGSAPTLVAARAVQGFATGAAITTLGAAILDADRVRGPLFNSITAFAGLALGVLSAAILATYAPDPNQLIYIVLLIVSVLEGMVLWYMPETAERRNGAFASLRPHVNVPPQARKTLVALTPVNVAAWALGGFYLSLMPSLVRVATGLVSPMVGGAVVATLMFTAGIAVIALRKIVAEKALLVGTLTFAVGVPMTLTGVHTQMVALMMCGTIIAGFGFGAAFSGTVRTLLPLAKADERAALLSAFYVESYLAFSLPAILVGLLAPVLGLTLVAYFYGSAVFVLAMISLIAMRASGNPNGKAG